jgi:hypothetical protein
MLNRKRAQRCSQLAVIGYGQSHGEKTRFINGLLGKAGLG